MYNAAAMMSINELSKRWSRALFIAMLLAVLTSVAAGHAAKAPPTIVFMTDFGTVDDSVAICKGVMYGIAPNPRIVDLTHQVTPFSILEGARFLYGATPYFAEGTVFAVVIDPGVGSARKAVIMKSKAGSTSYYPTTVS
jgi:hypothetical protein